jgi:hypothetical protein
MPTPATSTIYVRKRRRCAKFGSHNVNSFQEMGQKFVKHSNLSHVLLNRFQWNVAVIKCTWSLVKTRLFMNSMLILRLWPHSSMLGWNSVSRNPISITFIILILLKVHTDDKAHWCWHKQVFYYEMEITKTQGNELNSNVLSWSNTSHKRLHVILTGFIPESGLICRVYMSSREYWNRP